MRYKTARIAFEDLYDEIMACGTDFDGTKTLFNVSFSIRKPESNLIATPWRKWSLGYAEQEWEWYLSGNPNAEEISKRAKIWRGCMDHLGNVNSNYGYQWQRGDQLGRIIHMLRENPNTRKASISLYDGKEIHLYNNDTVCTYAISFTILNSKLNMSVMMRSQDLVYGFCNDQYCFSELQALVASQLGVPTGSYHHFVVNLHIYEKHWDMKSKHGEMKR